MDKEDQRQCMFAQADKIIGKSNGIDTPRVKMKYAFYAGFKTAHNWFVKYLEEEKEKEIGMGKKDKIIFFRSFEMIMDYMFKITNQRTDEPFYELYKHLEDAIIEWIKEE